MISAQFTLDSQGRADKQDGRGQWRLTGEARRQQKSVIEVPCRSLGEQEAWRVTGGHPPRLWLVRKDQHKLQVERRGVRQESSDSSPSRSTPCNWCMDEWVWGKRDSVRLIGCDSR